MSSRYALDLALLLAACAVDNNGAGGADPETEAQTGAGQAGPGQASGLRRR